MKKQLPNSLKTSKGFTLVELLIVIAILAILATISVSVFSNIQSKARDAKRKSDVVEIAQALDNARASADATTFPTLTDSLFTSGKIPVDPTSTRSYCIASQLTAVGPINADPAAWTTTCPVVPAANANSSAWALPVSGTTPATGAYKIRVCATTEDSPAQLVCATTQMN